MTNYINEPEATLDRAVRQTWAIALTVGLISIALGVAVMVWPGPTVLVVAILIGIQLILGGIYRLVAAIGGATDTPWLVAIAGLLVLVAGVFALRHPGGTVAILALIIGVTWVVSGIVELLAALFSPGYQHRIWMIVGASISIIAGGVVLAQPSISMSALAWVTGLFFVLSGVVLVLQAFAARP